MEEMVQVIQRLDELRLSNFINLYTQPLVELIKDVEHLAVTLKIDTRIVSKIIDENDFPEQKRLLLEHISTSYSSINFIEALVITKNDNVLEFIRGIFTTDLNSTPIDFGPQSEDSPLVLGPLSITSEGQSISAINSTLNNVSQSTILFQAGSNTTIHGLTIVHQNKNISSATDRLPLFFDVQDPIESFYGRTDFIQKLHERIQKDGTRLTVLSQLKAVSGIGGVGKTETARKYIQMYKNHYRNVIWINATNYSTMVNSFLNLAAHAQVNVQVKDIEGRHKDPTVIAQEIYTLICTHQTLIIFDDASHYDSEENQHGIRKFLPRALPSNLKIPQILITSRDQDAWENHTLFLEVFTIEESADFILQRLNFDPEQGQYHDNLEDARRLGELLDGLPLALQQAATFILEENKRSRMKRTVFTISQYIALYHKKRKKLLQFPPSRWASDSSITVYITWNITMSYIRELEYGVQAHEIMNALAFLDSASTSLTFLTALFEGSVSEEIIIEGLLLLERYSMIRNHVGSPESSESSTTTSIHQVVQHVTIEKLQEFDRYFSILEWLGESSLKFLEGQSPPYTDVKPFILSVFSLRDHFMSVDLADSERASDKESSRQIFIEFYRALAYIVMEIGMYTEEIKTIEHLYGQQMARLGVNDEKTIGALHALAQAHESAGNYGAALDMMKRAVDLFTANLGLEHRSTQAGQANLASIYSALGQHEDALAMLKELENFRRDQFGEADKMLPDYQLNRASVLVKIGRYKESAELLENVWRIKKEDEESPDKIQIRLNLSEAFLTQEKYGEALSMVEEAEKVCGDILVEDHPMTLEVLHNKAVALCGLGRKTEALKLWQEVLEKQTSRLGRSHAKTVVTLQNIGRVLIDMDELNEALVVFQDVLDLYGAAEAPDVEAVSIVHYNIADVLKKQGKVLEALEQYENCPKNRPIFTDFKHMSSQAMYENKGLLYYAGHPGIVCDGCPGEARSISGTRFKCRGCPQFNLCSACLYKIKHEHTDFSYKFGNFKTYREGSPHWTSAVADGVCPAGSLIGARKLGHEVILARGMYKNNLLPMELTVVNSNDTDSSSFCSLRMFGREDCVPTEFQTLVIPKEDVLWVPLNIDEYPVNAILGGITHDGDLLFITRTGGAEKGSISTIGVSDFIRKNTPAKIGGQNSVVEVLTLKHIER